MNLTGDVIHRATASLVLFHCPGCGYAHGVSVDGHRNELTGATWGWNGDMTRPTFTPSILTRGTVPVTDAEVEQIMRGEPFEPKPLVCHSFVRDGQIEFLGDCTHSLAGKTLPLPVWETT